MGNTGSIISLSYKPLVSPLAPQCHDLKPLTELSKEREYTFTSSISYSTQTPGMTIPVVLPKSRPPPGYQWIKRFKKTEPGASGAEDTDGGTFDPDGESPRDNQSFFRKYWYIILPLTIMTFIAPEEPPQGEQGQGGASGNARAGGAGMAAGAGTATAPVGVKQRRGKRG